MAEQQTTLLQDAERNLRDLVESVRLVYKRPIELKNGFSVLWLPFIFLSFAVLASSFGPAWVKLKPSPVGTLLGAAWFALLLPGAVACWLWIRRVSLRMSWTEHFLFRMPACCLLGAAMGTLTGLGWVAISYFDVWFLAMMERIPLPL